MSQLVSQSVSQLVSQSVNQSVGESVSQSVSQLIEQPFRQPNMDSPSPLFDLLKSRIVWGILGALSETLRPDRLRIEREE